MNNKDSNVVSRFRVSSMLIALILVLLLGSAALYSVYTGNGWPKAIVSTFNGIFVIWLAFNIKDWIRYCEIAKGSGSSGILNDELFQAYCAKAAKIGFFSLVIGQVGVILFDGLIYPIGASVSATFSLILGVSAFLVSLVIFELGE